MPGRDYGRLAAHLTPERCEQLLRDGFLVVDGWWGADWADALASELRALHEAGSLAPNRTCFAGQTLVKPNIFEGDLHEPAMSCLFSDALQEWGDWFAASGDGEFGRALAERLPSMRLRSDSRGRAVKLQANTGGSFPWHYDNPGPGCQRALTCLFYFNSEWEEGDGGELALLPFAASPIHVRPLHDRAVFFLSDRLLHRVLPSHALRFAVSTWWDGDVNGADSSLRLPPSAMADVEATALKLRGLPSQRALARAVYADEFESSLIECMMAGTEGACLMVDSHAEHVAAARKNAPLWALVLRLRELKPPDSAVTTL